MLITYEDSKEPVIVYKDTLFVQNRYKDHIEFHPGRLLFLTLSSPQLWQLTDKDIFVPHQKMTMDYHVYKNLQSEKEKILPLLRKTLTDLSLPDVSYFPMGDYEINPDVSTQSITRYGGKTEFLTWIWRLGDTKAIPHIRELLFHTLDPARYGDQPEGKDSYLIKDACIKVLWELWAKDILFEYLFQDKEIKHRHIQATLTALMQLGLTDADLPLLMKLCERYESLDKPANELYNRYLEKLFMEGWQGGTMRSQYMRWVLHDRDSDSPVQWLLCKAIARIETQKAVESLEEIYKHSIYYEMHKSALIGIRHRSFLQEQKIGKVVESQALPSLLLRIIKEYRDFDNRRILNTSKQHARTDVADIKNQEDSRKYKEIERQEEKERLARKTEYLKTLKPWDSIEIYIPFHYTDKDTTGIVIENDGEILLIESKFDNKNRLGRRKFHIKNGESTWPACFMDEGGWWKKPYFYSIIVPQPKKESSHDIKSWEIHVPIKKISEPKNDDTNDIPF